LQYNLATNKWINNLTSSKNYYYFLNVNEQGASATWPISKTFLSGIPFITSAMAYNLITPHARRQVKSNGLNEFISESNGTDYIFRILIPGKYHLSFGIYDNNSGRVCILVSTTNTSIGSFSSYTNSYRGASSINNIIEYILDVQTLPFYFIIAQNTNIGGNVDCGYLNIVQIPESTNLVQNSTIVSAINAASDANIVSPSQS